MPAALTIATVAEPTAKCISHATNQARTIKLISDPARSPEIALPTPLSIRTALNAPPAPITKIMLAKAGKLR
ncbi:hypothetical protein D3C76_1746360 [compost metagenome]